MQTDAQRNDISQPESTYRLQLHAGFTFREAIQIVPYLRDLGVTHVYVSPFLKARPGSTHGYDIVDHELINPEIGTREDYDQWSRTLAEHGLGLIIDVVPNHMGVASDENRWWNDVLENGPSSRYAAYFDISWNSGDREDLNDRVLLPVLAGNFGEVLEAGKFRLAFAEGAFVIHYEGRRFPVAPRSYSRILSFEPEALRERIPAGSLDFAEYQSILTAVNHLPDRSERDPARVEEREREKEVVKRRLAALVERCEEVRQHLEKAIAAFNGVPGEPASFDRLDDLLTHQCYRLAHWRVATDEINYRRFFDINDLAAISMEREDVFHATHHVLLEFVAEGSVHGLRIDHPDGLYDPGEYLRRLQTASPMLNVWVEKILGPQESLRSDWPVAGTTGYEFINTVNGLFVDKGGEREFTRLYRDFIEEYSPWSETAYRSRRLILRVSLASELHMLTRRLLELSRHGRNSRDFTLNTLREALREIIACFPVYRTYITDASEVSEADRRAVESAVRRAAARNPFIGESVLDFIRGILLLEHFAEASEERRAEQLRFVGKFQQVTSPVVAKGVEDTAFYRFVRLLSLNEVGGEPARFGISREHAHEFAAARARDWPFALSPLSTHDTKRGEDVRARLNVLSEIPSEWRAAVESWSALNSEHKRNTADGPAPDANDEYMIYQLLIGAWPLEPHSDDEFTRFGERILACVVKSLHEAKRHTSWINPNVEYDRATEDFVRAILDRSRSGRFLAEFEPFQRRIATLGLRNSLAQSLLKLTLPGAPDTYQGTELWDFSLVDPDNRRPVDFELRRKMLDDLRSAGESPITAGNWCDGRIKLDITRRVLQFRKQHPALFTRGEYRPVAVDGPRGPNVFAFERSLNRVRAIVAVTRLTAGAFAAEWWNGTQIRAEGTGRWRSLFTGRIHETGVIQCDSLFDGLPVVLLVADG